MAGNTKEELSFLKIPGASKSGLESKVRVFDDLCIPYKERHLQHRTFLNAEIYHRLDNEQYRKKIFSPNLKTCWTDQNTS